MSFRIGLCSLLLLLDVTLDLAGSQLLGSNIAEKQSSVEQTREKLHDDN